MKPGSSLQRPLLAAMIGAIALFALTPAFASARVTVPPGATEGDQYFEEVPNGGGSGSVDRSGGGSGSGGDQSVAATQALKGLGPDGQAAADLANSNKPPQGGGEKAGGGQSASSTEGEGGMGAFFPILIVVSAIAAVAYGLRRRLIPT